MKKLSSLDWLDNNALNLDKLTLVLRDFEAATRTVQPFSVITANQLLIEDVMAAGDIELIINAIVAVNSECVWFQQAQNNLKYGSALSAQLVYRQLTLGKSMGLAECFRMELDLALKSAQFGEFSEGVRALLIDKDKRPEWKYSCVAEVEQETLDWFFTPLWETQEHPLAALEL